MRRRLDTRRLREVGEINCVSNEYTYLMKLNEVDEALA